MLSNFNVFPDLDFSLFEFFFFCFHEMLHYFFFCRSLSPSAVDASFVRSSSQLSFDTHSLPRRQKSRLGLDDDPAKVRTNLIIGNYLSFFCDLFKLELIWGMSVADEAKTNM